MVERFEAHLKRVASFYGDGKQTIVKRQQIARITSTPITVTRHQNSSNLFKMLTGLLIALSVAIQFAGAIMSLPDGIENILGFVPRSSFQCERDGYFGDTDNDCRIFHLCQKQILANGRTVSHTKILDNHQEDIHFKHL